ncbi:Asp-tRNA(Asn)/Glu-tRNA(Gln) amidotransferase subunit GatA [Thermoactinomyces mirandus]|uniref:Glutamyl-tRNA(Gln) amidotransferase subunit A n=1 Tax=Thermoactinomyces mirandus TaxID=2756294 RepID=A0A7W2AR56_9BACL|nr:Asp-tRNA(Asn)/Glu-tRNA(Gln) amidotransferase subunit GatA [Thermoactinomyces mirandus]MBA4602213.1 Asp-tRNA(Asn)/Glu-tRNA(Gln) amidotransferase subunit GatA [Thermoactinomyces mirandus]
MSLFNDSLKGLHKRLAKREITASDLVNESLRRIVEVDSHIKAFIKVDEEGARQRARELDEKLASGAERGFLAALPAGIKDNICIEGMTTTCGSQLLSNYEPIYSATVMHKLAQAEAITMGKLNMDEFAMGSSTENSSYHPTRNPWNPEKVPGGSSGGSAASVAAREVYFSLGSDTGGSIRQPAAFCGVVGLKPTYGRVSRYGLVAFASSLDQIGPLTKNVEDTAYVLQVISGHDACDSTSANVEVPDYLSALTGEIKGMRIAVAKEMMGEGIDPSVRERVQEAIVKLEQMGAYVEEVSLPHTEYAVPAYYLIAPAEASSNLARYDGVRYGVRKEGKNLVDMYLETRSQGFGPEVKRRIMLGTYALSSGYYDAYYLKAQKVRTLIRQDFDKVFEQFDVIVGPTTPTTAFGIGEIVNDPLTMYMNDILTIPVNLAGLPAISIPCGLAEGMPVGLQIIGKPFDESTVLRVAHAYEQETGPMPAPMVGGKTE